MSPRKTLPILLLAAAAACGRNSKQTMQRGQQNYDVVQEGQASGATSTIAAPGETPPITNTAVDTTTNFTLPTATTASIPTATAGGTIAGTFPPPMTSLPVSRPQVTRRETPAPPPRASESTTTSRPPSNGPTTTDTQAPVPPPTDTAKSDQSWRDGQPQPKPADKKEEPKKDAPPPPPPPTTDTTATGTQGIR